MTDAHEVRLGLDIEAAYDLLERAKVGTVPVSVEEAQANVTRAEDALRAYRTRAGVRAAIDWMAALDALYTGPPRPSVPPVQRVDPPPVDVPPPHSALRDMR